MIFNQKRKSRRRRERARHYFNRTIVVFGLAIVGVLLYLALQSDAWDRLLNRSAAIASTSSGGGAANLASSSIGTSSSLSAAERDFQDFLDKSTPQRLILRSTELIDDENGELLERLSRQQDKLRIADSLLRLKEDVRSSNYGKLSKLKTLRKRETIHFDHGLSSESSVSELQDYAYRAAGSANEEIAQEAQLGKLYARLFRTLTFDDTANVKAIEPALREFKSVCEKRVQDADTARELYSLLERIHVRLPETSSRRFISDFKRVFKASPSTEIRDLAETADDKIMESEFEFIDVYGKLSIGKTEAMDTLFQQVKRAIQRPNVSAQGLKNVLQQIRNLGNYGRYEQALECAELLQRRVAARDSLLPVVRQAQALRQKYKLAGTKFDFSLVKKASSDEAFGVRFPDATVKGMLFFKGDTVTQAQEAIVFIMGIAGRYLSEERFCLSVIFLNDGNFRRELEEFRAVERLLPLIDTGIIDIQIESGKQFVDQFSLQRLPQLILLDRDSRITAVSVETVDFERRFNEMLDAR